MTKSQKQSSAISCALGFVLTWFGTSEIMSPQNWTSYVPTFFGTGSLVNTLVIVHGTLLVVCAILLVLDVTRPIIGVIVALMLAEIVVNLILSNGGLNPVSVRDIGLLGTALALVFSEKYSIDPIQTSEQKAKGLFPDYKNNI